MQTWFPFDCRGKLLQDIHGRLCRRFGPLARFDLTEPMDQLVLSFLSSRTTGERSYKAYVGLLERYENWEVLRQAPIVEIQRIISPVTYAEIKAPNLKQVLILIAQINGELTLKNLSRMAVDAALAWLERMPGVGRKIAASVLNFSILRKRALVIDTHHLRVLKRLGLLNSNASFERAYDRMMMVLPKNWVARDLDDHHCLMKQLGQSYCFHTCLIVPGVRSRMYVRAIPPIYCSK